MNYSGPERRSRDEGIEQVKAELSKISTDLALLLNQTNANHRSLRESINRTETAIEKHDKTLYGNGSPGLTTKVSELTTMRSELKEHDTRDKWMFGIIITIGLFILGKLFTK